MRLAQQTGIVYLIKPADHNAAGIDGDSFSLKNFSHATVILQFGALTGNSVLTVNSGATAGAKTTAETFAYRLASGDQGAASADQFDTEATSAALTLTAATYDNKTLIVEIPANSLTEDQPWVTINVDATASQLFVAAVAILSGPRFAPPLTAIA